MATASNLLYAAPKIGLDLKPHLDSLVLPVLRKKVKYLHIEGIAEALWGLTVLGVSDNALILQLLEASKGRKFVSETTQGSPSWLDHHQYQPAQAPVPGRQLTLLQEALQKLSQSADPGVKAEAGEQLKLRTAKH